MSPITTRSRGPKPGKRPTRIKEGSVAWGTPPDVNAHDPEAEEKFKGGGRGLRGAPTPSGGEPTTSSVTTGFPLRWLPVAALGVRFDRRPVRQPSSAAASEHRGVRRRCRRRVRTEIELRGRAQRHDPRSRIRCGHELRALPWQRGPNREPRSDWQPLRRQRGTESVATPPSAQMVRATATAAGDGRIPGNSWVCSGWAASTPPKNTGLTSAGIESGQRIRILGAGTPVKPRRCPGISASSRTRRNGPRRTVIDHRGTGRRHGGDDGDTLVETLDMKTRDRTAPGTPARGGKLRLKGKGCRNSDRSRQSAVITASSST